MKPGCRPRFISRGEPAYPSSLTCGCTLGAKKRLTISLNMFKIVMWPPFLNPQQALFKTLIVSIINLRNPWIVLLHIHQFHISREPGAEKEGERTCSYSLFTFKFRWQLCEMIINSCWYVLVWFSTQHLPSLHNAACCVSNFGVLELQQKYNSYYSYIST